MKKLLLFSAFAFSTLLWSCMTDHNVPSAVSYKLDDTKSVAEWKGYLRTGYFNEGAISVKSEQLIVNEGKVTGGSFTIPVSSIVNFNLPTDSIKHLLVHHLQSPDFFNMAIHPNLTYDITSVTPYSGTEGVAGANYQVQGNLTMLGKTNPVSFPAKIDLNNNQMTVDATLKVDRTKWGITYAADPALPADSQIQPNIDIHLKLVGSKQ
ncbi:YceI family protein [Spirosoma sp.]|uniref:YceI family protein n=1 Tax=Spirosoma sp. TaxID=1899569 RepID=UPI003B3BA4A5